MLYADGARGFLFLSFSSCGAGGRDLSTLPGITWRQVNQLGWTGRDAAGVDRSTAVDRTTPSRPHRVRRGKALSPPLSEASELRGKTLVFLFLPALAASCCFTEAATLTACSACSKRCDSARFKTERHSVRKACRPSGRPAPPLTILAGAAQDLDPGFRYGPHVQAARQQHGRAHNMDERRHLAELHEGCAEALDGILKGRGEVDSCFVRHDFETLKPEARFSIRENLQNLFLGFASGTTPPFKWSAMLRCGAVLVVALSLAGPSAAHCGNYAARASGACFPRWQVRAARCMMIPPTWICWVVNLQFWVLVAKVYAEPIRERVWCRVAEIVMVSSPKSPVLCDDALHVASRQPCAVTSPHIETSIAVFFMEKMHCSSGSCQSGCGIRP